jgi:hypothetical protein
MAVSEAPVRLAPRGQDSGESYVSRLATRASLYSELRSLLTAVAGAPSREQYRRAVIEDNVLGRGTRAAREKAWKELAARYGFDGTSAIFRAYLEEYRRATSEADHALTSYLLFAVRDRLVRDLGTEWLYEYLRAAPAELRPVDVLAFLASREPEHPEIAAWSASSRANIAVHYLSALKEFGLARGGRRKLTIRPSPGAPPVRFLLRALLLSGATELAAVESPLFRLLGLSLEDTVALLSQLTAASALRCRIQGDVVDLDLGTRNGA